MRAKLGDGKLKNKKRHLLIILLLAFSQACCTWLGRKIPLPETSSDRIWVAHAGGGYMNRAYLNCFECFEENYKKGHRFFEFDLMMTNDQFVVAIYDGQEKDYGLPAPPLKFTLQQYKDSGFAGTKRLPESEFVRLMNLKRDWFLITDVKDDNLSALQKLSTTFESENIDWRRRVIPQVYTPDEIETAKKNWL